MSIDTQSMIGALESGLPRQSFKLLEEAEQIAKENKAEKGSVKASMYYFKSKDPTDPKGKREIDGLQLLKDHIAEYKKAFRSLARYPYRGEFYLVPAAGVDDLLKIREKYEGDLKTATWTKWADDEYPKWQESAPERMGHLYDKSDFPALSECMSRFKVELSLLPLAPKEQVARIALIAPKTQTFLKEHADATSKKAIEDLHKQIWQDLMKPLEHVVTTFEKDKPKVYETLLGNLFDIVNVIPNYNSMLGDPELALAAESIKAKLGKMTTEDLRSSDEKRKEAFTSAKELVNVFTPYARKFV